MKYILMVIFLSLPVTAQAAWTEAPVPSPNFNPGQGQFTQHEVHVTPPVRVEPQHREPPRPIVHYTASPNQPVHIERPVEHNQDTRHYEKVTQDHPFRHSDFDRHRDDNITYVIDTPAIAVPDGFDMVVVDGQPYYYNDGVFYQLAGDQLVAIAPVLGAVVNYIPENYVIITADGVNYLFINGVYYQRVEQGFEVVEGPGSDQG